MRPAPPDAAIPTSVTPSAYGTEERMSTSGDERFARATLCAVAEPGDAMLGRLIARLGPVGALDAIRTGSAPAGVVAGEHAGLRLAERLESWRIRLGGADPN